MKDELKQDLLHSLFCFKKAVLSISRFLLKAEGSGLSAAELSALNCIGLWDEKGCDAADVSHPADAPSADASHPADQTTHHAMHETLGVSKAAISQMLGSIGKRGYIQREIDRDNRRKIIITVTKKGKAAVEKGGQHMDLLMSRIITGFGEKDARNFVQLLDRFVEVVDEEASKTG
ncbi:MAG: MarR family winged helix-turn-helix transcriptional regulator [Treponema sp.]|jgi:DNA-binding MarR family transcriptional regulator|nr:MarR family winged helix-turn-helix transcriptional regulator [Treponema sp.]